MLTRYLAEAIILGLLLFWYSRQKKRRRNRIRRRIKRQLNRRRLLQLATVFAAIFFVIPTLCGRISPTARYLPQYLEAHKLRAYYLVVSLVPGLNASQQQIERQITRSAAKYPNLSPSLLKAVVATESSFDQYALSVTGACGLMQVMPNTFYGVGGGNPFDYRANLNAGAKYLSQLLSRYQGSVDHALAAYNGGPSRVKLGANIPGYTRQYVQKVKRYRDLYR